MSQYPNQSPNQPANPGAINPDKPIDGVIAGLIQRATAASRGFAVSCAADIAQDGGKGVTFRVEQVLPPADEWEPPSAYRDHVVSDVDSLVSMAKKYSNAEHGLILVDNDGVVLVLDETKERGERETISLEWEFSKAWEAWNPFVNGEAQQHKPLFKFLTRRQGDLEDADVLHAMRTVKATATVKLDSNLRDLGETVGVVFETQGGDDMVKFPKHFNVVVPIFEDDDHTTLRINVEIVMPAEPRAPVTFLLLSDDWDNFRRKAIQAQITKMRAALRYWTIVRGTHRTERRELGRPK